MKTSKNKKDKDSRNIAFEMFEKYFLKQREDQEREKQVLLDVFNIHVGDKEIVLENSK